MGWAHLLKSMCRVKIELDQMLEENIRLYLGKCLSEYMWRHQPTYSGVEPVIELLKNREKAIAILECGSLSVFLFCFVFVLRVYCCRAASNIMSSVSRRVSSFWPYRPTKRACRHGSACSLEGTLNYFAIDLTHCGDFCFPRRKKEWFSSKGKLKSVPFLPYVKTFSNTMSSNCGPIQSCCQFCFCFVFIYFGSVQDF